TLSLFQQIIQQNALNLQFLSDKPLAKDSSPQTLNITPPNSKNHAIIKTAQTAERVLLLGSNLMMANLFYLAKIRSTTAQNQQTLALLHSEDRFPFRVKPALIMAPNLPPEAIGTSSLLEDWNIPNRLTSQSDLPGCFDGTLEELFAYWLAEQHNDCHESWQVIICASNEIQKKCLNVNQPYDWIHCLGIHYDLNRF
ncbi:MAG: hypothetical protein L3J01_02695, partial [Thiomicrorhabdus sp.]|nr:hypothetical protein [Thiomicrorhabdus sp.]